MSRLERDRIQEADNDIDSRSGSYTEGSSTELVQLITETTYPTNPSSYFACQPLLVDGAEREGATASFTPDPSRLFYAYNLGTQLPPVGLKTLAFDGGGRRVFRYDG